MDDLYRSTLVRIPAPEFVVFYNGTEKQPERKEFRLSDAYITRPEDPKLELKVTMFNINAGCNMELMSQCKTLHDYAVYTDRVRFYAKTMPLDEAVEKAVNECIRDGILREFLLSQRAEAVKVTIYEFDQARHERAIREDARNEGRNEILRAQVQKKLVKGKTVQEIADDLEETTETVERIVEEIGKRS